jgi:hypothetical protein
MLFVTAYSGIWSIAAHIIDEYRGRPGAVPGFIHTIVIFRRTIITIAGVDRDALALLIKITTQAAGIDCALRVLQGPDVIDRVPASCREVWVSEFDFTTVAVVTVTNECLPGIFDQWAHRFAGRVLGTDANDFYPANGLSLVRRVVTLTPAKQIKTLA